MACYVHLHLAFACDNPEALGALADMHLQRMLDGAGEVPCQEALWFLRHLASRPPLFVGPKGGLCLWGLVGNYTSGVAFVETLSPFWRDLLATDLDGFPGVLEHVLVFEEPEQFGYATAYEISLSDEGQGPLIIVAHPCPFGWQQS